jgi:catechol 2,3-dioxygenase-like lactoylglutathione lyase family enzyme
MPVSATRAITVGVADLEAALRLFAGTMGLRVEWHAALDPGLLGFWGLPATARARAVELSCRGYPWGRLRLVQFEPGSPQRVRDDFGPGAPDSPLDVGPKAIDFYVADPIATPLAQVVAAGYPARSAPRLHQIGHSISEEVVITGPDALPVLLMVGHRHRETSLRPGSPDGPFSEIATASVICGDLGASRRFYGECLGLAAVNDAETPDEYRALVDDLVDAPPGTRVHFLLYAAPGEASGKILLIHFFERTGRRLAGRMRPGHLGFSMFSHETGDLDALHRSLRAAGVEVLRAPCPVPTPEGERRAMLVRGPNEEMFEFVER